MKKFLTVFIIVFTMFNFTYGADLIDVISSEEVLKFSENVDITLPFVSASSDRMILDEDVDKSGILYSAKNMLAEKDLKGLHFLTSVETVTINGSIENSIILAKNVIINGSINRDTVIIAGSVVVSEEANVLGDLILFTSKADLRGTFNENVIGYIEELNFSGNVLKDLRVDTYNLTVSEKSNVSGNVVINTENKEITKENSFSNAVIEYQEVEDSNYNKDYFDIIIGFVINSILFALIYLLFRNKSKVINNTLTKVKENGTFFAMSGILSIFLSIVAAIVLFMLSLFGFAIITMPLLMILTVLMVVFGILSTLTLGSVIFKYVEEEKEELFKGTMSILFGSFVVFFGLQLITLIPYIGGYISFVIICLSFSILWTNIFKKNNKKEIEKVLENDK